MKNWKRILAAAGTAALLVSNMGSISQTVFAVEDYTEDISDESVPVESSNNDQSSDSSVDDYEEPRLNTEALIDVLEADAEVEIPPESVSVGEDDSDSAGNAASDADGADSTDLTGAAGHTGAAGDDNASDNGGTDDSDEVGGADKKAGADDTTSAQDGESTDTTVDEDAADAANADADENTDGTGTAQGDAVSGDGTDADATDSDATAADADTDTTNIEETDPESTDEDGSDDAEEDEVYDLDDSLAFELEVTESKKREVTRDDDGVYLYNLGETASTTITISNPEEYALKESDDAVVRLYMQFTDTVDEESDDTDGDAVCGKTRQAGTYTAETADGTEYEYTVYALDDGATCYEFERPIDGDSYEAELTSVYKSDTNGGENKIWAVALTADEAEELDQEAADAEDNADEDARGDVAESSKASDDDPSDEKASDDTADRKDDDDRVIGVADEPDDADEITTLRWIKEVREDYPAFEDEQEMSDGTVITVDAPEGAFPEGIQLALKVKDPADYLDAIRAYRGLEDDEELSTENWLAYDFDFYTDDEHHNIEPETDIKVTFSNLTRLTELAKEAAANAEVASNDEDADIALADLDEDAETANSSESSEFGGSAEDSGSSTVTVYHIADVDSDENDNRNSVDKTETVTETTVTDVNPEAGTITIETDAFSTQLLDLDDGIMLAAQATNNTTVDHIDIGISANASVTINGQQQTVSVTLEESDFSAGNVSVTAAFQNGSGTPYFTTNNFSDIERSSGTSGIAQFRIGGTYRTGTLSNPAVYTFTLKKNVTFTLDGEEVTIPVTLSESFHYFQSDNDCPGIHNSENTSGNVADASGMDFVLKFDLKLIVIYKEVVDENGNPLNVDQDYTYNFTVDKSVDSEGVPIAISSGENSGFGIEQVSEISEVTVTEETPARTVVSNGQTYSYLRTTINETDVTNAGLKLIGNNVSSFTVKNYYSGKPLTVEKKWYNNDGSEITDGSQLPESIEGTLYQMDHVDADPGKEGDQGVTLTIKADYPYSYSGYGNYMYQTTTFTYTVATGGDFSGYVYGTYSSTSQRPPWTTTTTERTISGITVQSGNASVSNNGNTIRVENITENTTVRVTYTSLVNNAPVMNNPEYDKPDTTTIDPTPESNTTKKIPFTLAPSSDSKTNWRKEFTAEELNEQVGHTYKYYVSEVSVPGYSTTITKDSETNALTKTNTDYVITISNTKGYELPSTGGAGTIPFEVGGSAAILSSMVVGYSRRRRHRKEGE